MTTELKASFILGAAMGTLIVNETPWPFKQKLICILAFSLSFGVMECYHQQSANLFGNLPSRMKSEIESEGSDDNFPALPTP